MPGIDARELIWRAYTANPADFKDRAKKIISYAKNQEVGRQLFLKSGSQYEKDAGRVVE